MMGMLLWKDPQEARGKVYVAERSVLHARFLCAEVARGSKTRPTTLRRRVQAAGKRLRKQGVDRVVLPEDFAAPYEEALAKCGLRPLATLSLGRALAADWVGRLLAEGGTKIAVAADRLTGELTRTVTELALRHRYVLLDVGYGGEELARRLRREYGVSLLLAPGKAQLEEADALVLFDKREDLRPKTPAVLRLYEGGGQDLPVLSLPPALEDRLPAGIHRGQMLSALREAGVLRLEQIAIA